MRGNLISPRGTGNWGHDFCTLAVSRALVVTERMRRNASVRCALIWASTVVIEGIYEQVCVSGTDFLGVGNFRLWWCS